MVMDEGKGTVVRSQQGTCSCDSWAIEGVRRAATCLKVPAVLALLPASRSDVFSHPERKESMFRRSGCSSGEE